MDRSEFTEASATFLVTSERLASETRVAVLANGNVIAIWPAEPDYIGAEVRAQLFSPDGTPIGSDFILADVGAGPTWREDERPEIVALSNGGFVVTWARVDGYNVDLGIYAARYGATGQQIGSITRLDAQDDFYEYDASLTSLSNGGFAVIWTRNTVGETTGNDVYLRLFSSSLAPTTPEILVNQYVDGSQNFANVTQLSNGNVVVAWRNYIDPDGSFQSLYVRVLDTSGAAISDEIRVNPEVRGATASDVIALAGGGFVVAWQNPELGMVARRFDGDGAALGDLLVLSAANRFNEPVITALQDGGFALMTREGGTYDDDSIVLRRFSPQGEQIGGLHELAGDDEYIYEFPSDLAQGADGSIMAVWNEGPGNIWNPSYGQVLRLNALPEGRVDVTGMFQQGQTVTAAPAITDADGMGSSLLTYQWLRSGVEIDGANSASYTLLQSDVGHAISVAVHYTDDLGTTETVTSDPTAVANANDPVDGLPILRGDPVQGQDIYARVNELSDADGLGPFSYQWLMNGVEIDGRTTIGVNLTQEHVGQEISVRVSFVDGGGTLETATSLAVTIANLNDPPEGDVQITGTAIEDGTLGVDASGLSDADGLGLFSYQWLRNGIEIEGAIGTSLALGDADGGQMISVRVRYVDGFGTSEVVDSAAVRVTNVNDLPTGLPIIQGTSAIGFELGADTSGIGDGDGLGVFSYQWLRNGAEISGAQGQTYTPLIGDHLATISVRVLYTDLQGTTESLLSTGVSIDRINIPPEGVPVVVGDVILGRTLTADTSGISDFDGLGPFSFQWLRDGVAIPGATTDTYVLTLQDAGAQLMARVSYVDAEGTDESVDSVAQTINFPANTPATGGVTIMGTGPFYAGDTLIMFESFTDPDGVASGYSRQWLRNGEPISGATSDRYLLTEEDEGQQISARSTYVDGLGYHEVLNSPNAVRVLQVLDPPTPDDFSDQFWFLNDQVHNPRDPFLAALTGGDFVGVWDRNGEDGTGFGSYGMRFDAQGRAIGPEFRVNDLTDQHEVNPEVIGLPGGGFAVTFYRDTNGYEPSQEGVFLQFYDETGARVGDNITVYSGRMAIGGTYGPGVDGPKITALSDGSVVVIWPLGYLDAGVYFQRVSADGALLGPRVEIASDIGQNFRPSVTALTDGGFVAYFWTFPDGYGAGPSVVGQRFDATGAASSAQFEVWGTTRGGGPSNVAVINAATHESGHTAVVFSDTVFPSSGLGHYDTFIRIYDPDGNPVNGAATLVHAPDPDDQFGASVTAVENGFLVVWEMGLVSGGVSDIHIMAQLFDLRGDPFGDAFQLDQFDAHSSARPSVASNDNDVIVAWFDEEYGANAGDGITGRSFTVGDGAPQPVGATEGPDSLTGTDADDSIVGLGGDDSLSGRAGNDTVQGNEGNDTVHGGSGDDNVSGADGNDVVFLGSGSDLAGGGAGDDQITVESATPGDVNQIWAGPGNDTIRGNSSVDRVDGGDGLDTLIGGGGDDFLVGGSSEADLRDVIYGGAGDDTINGGYGNDELRGDAGNDTILGGFGADTVIGGDGDDQLTAQAYGDEIFGGAGADFINGGFGHDRVNGGADADRFFHIGIFDHGSDWIQDYTAADGDILQFGQAGDVSQFQVNFTETASAGTAGVEEAFVIYRPTGQILWALVDGQAQSSINLLTGGETYDLLA